MQMSADLVVERVIEDQSYGRKIVDVLGNGAENAAKCNESALRPIGNSCIVWQAETRW